MQRRSLLVVLAAALIVTVTGCAKREPQVVEVTRQVEVPHTVEVTREVTRVVEKLARETVEVTRLVETFVTATPSTPLPPALTAAPSPSLAIESFTVDAVELSGGRRRLTFAWKTRGATSVSIRFVTRPRFFPCWGNLPPNGTEVFQGDAIYPNPGARLFAEDSEGKRVAEDLKVDWPCQHQYFFTAETETDCAMPSPRRCSCPRHAAIVTQAAEQPFENGRMIWLQGTDDEPSYPDTIVVLYDHVVHEGTTNYYQAEVYEDTWTPDEPDRDSNLVPSSGLFQPIRGFGKLWRENTSVRERIGWATAPEQGFEGAWQPLETEHVGGRDVFLRTIDGRVVLFSGYWMSGGSWRFVTP